MHNKIFAQPRRRYGMVKPRVVYVLFVAWLAFSFTGVLEHCCRAMAAGHEHTTEVAAVAPAGAISNYGRHGEDNDHCPQLTASAAIASAAPLLPGSADVMFVVASYRESELAATKSVATLNFHPPPSPWRLYLSTQRLRI
jgi:hypothetical protein